jgi:chromosome partitioning protein
MTTALVAADWFIIPVFPSGYDLQGLEVLTRTINKIREKYNPNLKLAGVLLGNYDKSAKLDSQIHDFLTGKFGDQAVFQTTIGRSVRMRELTVTGRTVFEHEPAKVQADQFLNLVKEMINRASKGQNTLNPLPKLEEVVEQASSTPSSFMVSPEMLEVGNG